VGAGPKASRTWSSSLWTRGTPVKITIKLNFEICPAGKNAVLLIRIRIHIGLLEPDPQLEVHNVLF
jgi:hypothetical protein